jgi:hypothetical protein
MIKITNCNDKIELNKNITNHFSESQKKRYNILQDAYLFLSKKYYRSVDNVKKWKKDPSELKVYSMQMYSKKGLLITTIVTSEPELEDNIELCLYRSRDLLAILFNLIALISEIKNKGNSLPLIKGSEKTEKILEKLESKKYFAEDFDKFIKEHIETIKIIIDARNSLKTNGTGHLVLRENNLWYQQMPNKVSTISLKSKTLSNNEFVNIENWALEVTDFHEIYPRILEELLYILNNLDNEYPEK